MLKDSPKNWLFNRIGDFWGIFFIPLSSIIFLFYNNNHLTYSFYLFFLVINLFLSGGHNWGPILYFLVTPNERDRVKTIQPKIYLFLMASLMTPIIITLTSFIFFTQNNTVLKIKTLVLYGFIYFFWNNYHFVKQQQGLLSLYKSKVARINNTERMIDTVFCFIFLGFLPAIFWYFYGIRYQSFQTLFDLKQIMLPISQTYKSHIVGIFGVSAAILILHFWRSPNKSLPVFLMYTIIFIQSLGMAIHPIFFTLVIFSATHWLQEIYLVSHYIKKDHRRSYITIFFILLLISALAFVIYNSKFIRNNSMDVFGNIRGLTDLTNTQYLLSAIVMGFLLGLNFTHFCLDRYLHKGRAWS